MERPFFFERTFYSEVYDVLHLQGFKPEGKENEGEVRDGNEGEEEEEEREEDEEDEETGRGGGGGDEDGVSLGFQGKSGAEKKCGENRNSVDFKGKNNRRNGVQTFRVQSLRNRKPSR